MIACCAGDLSGLVVRTGEERRDEKKSTAEIDERHGHCSLWKSRRCGKSKASSLSFSNCRKGTL